ncbi:hypothetical protein [Burkholderia sp. ABCPW 14]|uniref:hypothetical protein n=1 Tax=Burkholderia sp. ABCPW 14 TaxID=1637860 RepID=UPI0012E3D9E4|nr:hypothetical protein [Burkholderia sp. ABCPW 14]
MNFTFDERRDCESRIENRNTAGVTEPVSFTQCAKPLRERRDGRATAASRQPHGTQRMGMTLA